MVVSISWTCSLLVGIELRCNSGGGHRKSNRLERKSGPGDRTARIAGNRIGEGVMGIVARVSHGRQAESHPSSSFCLAPIGHVLSDTLIRYCMTSASFPLCPPNSKPPVLTFQGHIHTLRAPLNQLPQDNTSHYNASLLFEAIYIQVRLN